MIESIQSRPILPFQKIWITNCQIPNSMPQAHTGESSPPRFPTIVEAKHGGVALQNPWSPAARQRAPPPPLPAVHFPRVPAATSDRRRTASPRSLPLTPSRNVFKASAESSRRRRRRRVLIRFVSARRSREGGERVVEALPLRPRRHHLRPRHMAALPEAGEGHIALTP
jgi:hypothetical protein